MFVAGKKLSEFSVGIPAYLEEMYSFKYFPYALAQREYLR